MHVRLAWRSFRGSESCSCKDVGVVQEVAAAAFQLGIGSCCGSWPCVASSGGDVVETSGAARARSHLRHHHYSLGSYLGREARVSAKISATLP